MFVNLPMSQVMQQLDQMCMCVMHPHFSKTKCLKITSPSTLHLKLTKGTCWSCQRSMLTFGCCSPLLLCGSEETSLTTCCACLSSKQPKHCFGLPQQPSTVNVSSLEPQAMAQGHGLGHPRGQSNKSWAGVGDFR